MYEASGTQEKKRTRLLPYLFGGLTGISMALVVVAAILLHRNSVGTTLLGLDAGTSERPAASAASLDEGRRNSVVRATEQVAPAVVSITATYTRRTRPVYDWFWNRYYPGRVRTEANQGSGFIIDKKGYAFTNFHVIANAQRISVSLSNGKTYIATLVGSAPSHDLALLKLEGDDFPAALLGDSDDLLIGEWAIAIGSPYGTYLADTQPTVTVGVISAVHRDIKQDDDSEQIFNDMIQTDAAINPGNSGGPLVNSRGEVIGINTVIFSETRGNIGMGFAIPINRARHVLQEIVDHGRVRDVWLGLTAVNITPELAMALELPAETGVLIQAIEEGGPAARAGIRAGDQIVAINGVTVRSREHSNRLIFGSGVGDEIEITVNRRDQLLKIKVKLEERPSDI